MDSFTHIAFGACMGEAFAGKTLGKKAMIWGAVAQSVPDIDFISSFWMDTPSALLAHRGFTHSFLFCMMIVPVFGLLAERWHRPHNISLQKWMLFFGAAISIHIFIDAFNNYGVGWFEPFSHKRISFNSIYVADPFFSIWPGISCIMLILLKKGHAGRRKWLRAGLWLSGLYLFYCLVNKYQVDKDVKSILQKQHISYTGYFTTPAPLQNWLWFVVAGNDSGYYIGFRSLFDSKNKIDLTYFPRNDSMLNTVKGYEDISRLIRFSQGFYTIERWQDTLVFNDLRFGQVIGWQNPKGRFVFQYYLEQPGANTLVIQRGRFEGWNFDAFRFLLKRIGGN